LTIISLVVLPNMTALTGVHLHQALLAMACGMILALATMAALTKD